MHGLFTNMYIRYPDLSKGFIYPHISHMYISPHTLPTMTYPPTYIYDALTYVRASYPHTSHIYTPPLDALP